MPGQVKPLASYQRLVAFNSSDLTVNMAFQVTSIVKIQLRYVCAARDLYLNNVKQISHTLYPSDHNACSLEELSSTHLKRSIFNCYGVNIFASVSQHP